MFFADDATEASPVPAAAAEANTDIKVVPSSGDASSIRQAAAFMMEYFWLSSPQNLLAAGDDPSSLSDAAKAKLVEEQENDLTETYGEIMGKRTLESCLLTAEDDGGLLGLVGIESRLYNKDTNQIVSAEKSQALLKNAVASLGSFLLRLSWFVLYQIFPSRRDPDVAALPCVCVRKLRNWQRRNGISTACVCW